MRGGDIMAPVSRQGSRASTQSSHWPRRFGEFLYESPVSQAMVEHLRAVAALSSPVVLEGETGTGKDLLAREIHGHSPRRHGPFVVVDCAAIPSELMEGGLFGYRRGAFTGAEHDRPGAFEAASGGTLFLDEIGELELRLQPKLLRAADGGLVRRLGESHYRKADVRIVAASHRSLQRGVKEGWFRADLYYRLAVSLVRVPPLRKRPEDVALLADRLLEQIGERLRLERAPELSPELRRLLVEHDWPGNVRELRNCLERWVINGCDPAGAVPPGRSRRELPSTDLTSPLLDRLGELTFHEAKSAWVASFDRAYLELLLRRCGFNVAEAARRANINRSHLFRLIKKYGIERSEESSTGGVRRGERSDGGELRARAS
jgi:transcriptional regulator with GAF, ATPase, and Fis domain